MNLNDIIVKVETSNEYSEVMKENPNCYLTHVLHMTSLDDIKEYQVGYYNKDNDKIITFALSNGNIQVMPAQDVFKKPGSVVKELFTTNFGDTTFEEVDKLANEFQVDKFPKYLPIKKMIILQNIAEHDTVWNVTFFTGTADILNVRINPETKEVIYHNLVNLMNKEQSFK